MGVGRVIGVCVCVRARVSGWVGGRGHRTIDPADRSVGQAIPAALCPASIETGPTDRPDRVTPSITPPPTPCPTNLTTTSAALGVDLEAGAALSYKPQGASLGQIFAAGVEALQVCG